MDGWMYIMHRYVRTYIHTNVRTHVHTSTYMHTYIHIQTYVHTYILTYIRACVCVCVCVCVYRSTYICISCYMVKIKNYILKCLRDILNNIENAPSVDDKCECGVYQH